MGLSGRKVKQRIGNDPRNLSWADDAARFGSNYLAKFGWDSSKGLGPSGEGRTSHISVSQKLNMLGIGASQQRDPNGIAWQQNKDFESLLKRMNGGDSTEKVEESSKAEEPNTEEKETKKRKRKQDDQLSKKKKHKKKTEEALNVEDVVSIQPILPDESVERRTVPIRPRHRAHRSRAIAAKDISSKSAGHISEVLGIAPSPSSSYTPVSSTSNPSTPKCSSDNANESNLERITTSAKTVGDYFKEKLKSKNSKSVDWGSTCSERRGGLGSSSRAGLRDFLDRGG